MAKSLSLSFSSFLLLLALGYGLRMQRRRRRRSRMEANGQVNPNIPFLSVFIYHGGRARSHCPNLPHSMRQILLSLTGGPHDRGVSHAHTQQ